ncbi:MAG: winged helix-turn-helix domain-containing protein [Chloroflexota bacterium]
MKGGTATILLVTGRGIEDLGIGPELEGFRVRTESGDGLPDSLGDNARPDLVLVDFRLPRAPALCRQVTRETGCKLVGLLPHGSLGTLVGDVGLDDFVVMPPEPHELSLRIRRCLDGELRSAGQKVLHLGGLSIDPGRCEVTVAGEPVLLTFREYQLLRFLAENRGRVFSREHLLDHVWGYDYYGGDRTVDVHIRRLRAKLEPCGHSFIETVRNIGYRCKDIH